MVILTNRFGLVKVTVHLIERFQTRFKKSAQETRDLVEKILENGSIHLHTPNNDVSIRFGHYTVKGTMTESGHLILKTGYNFMKKPKQKKTHHYFKNGKKGYANG